MTGFYEFANQSPFLTVILGCLVVSAISAIASAFRPKVKIVNCKCSEDKK